jgi:hypothetical protein
VVEATVRKELGALLTANQPFETDLRKRANPQVERSRTGGIHEALDRARAPASDEMTPNK